MSAIILQRCSISISDVFHAGVISLCAFECGGGRKQRKITPLMYVLAVLFLKYIFHMT